MLFFSFSHPLIDEASTNLLHTRLPNDWSFKEATSNNEIDHYYNAKTLQEKFDHPLLRNEITYLIDLPNKDTKDIIDHKASRKFEEMKTINENKLNNSSSLLKKMNERKETKEGKITSTDLDILDLEDDFNIDDSLNDNSFQKISSKGTGTNKDEGGGGKTERDKAISFLSKDQLNEIITFLHSIGYTSSLLDRLERSNKDLKSILPYSKNIKEIENSLKIKLQSHHELLYQIRNLQIQLNSSTEVSTSNNILLYPETKLIFTNLIEAILQNTDLLAATVTLSPSLVSVIIKNLFKPTNLQLDQVCLNFLSNLLELYLESKASLRELESNNRKDKSDDKELLNEANVTFNCVNKVFERCLGELANREVMFL